MQQSIRVNETQAYSLLAEFWHAQGEPAKVAAMVQQSMQALSAELDPVERIYALDRLRETLAATKPGPLFTRLVDLAAQIENEDQKARAMRVIAARMQSTVTPEGIRKMIALVDSFTDAKSATIAMGALSELLWGLRLRF